MKGGVFFKPFPSTTAACGMITLHYQPAREDSTSMTGTPRPTNKSTGVFPDAAPFCEQAITIFAQHRYDFFPQTASWCRPKTSISIRDCPMI